MNTALKVPTSWRYSGFEQGGRAIVSQSPIKAAGRAVMVNSLRLNLLLCQRIFYAKTATFVAARPPDRERLSTSDTLPRIGSSLRNPRMSRPRNPRRRRTRGRRVRFRVRNHRNLGSRRKPGSQRTRHHRNLGSHRTRRRNLGSRRSHRNHRIPGLAARRYQSFPYRRDERWRG